MVGNTSCERSIGFGCADQVARQRPPRAVEFTVPAGTRVVTVTGPNTGGKTASLKALGLAALMPKAGLFLPLETSGKRITPPLVDRHALTPLAS